MMMNAQHMRLKSKEREQFLLPSSRNTQEEPRSDRFSLVMKTINPTDALNYATVEAYSKVINKNPQEVRYCSFLLLTIYVDYAAVEGYEETRYSSRKRGLCEIFG